MITAVDSSILLDVPTDDPKFATRSIAALETALAEGTLVICDMVVPEISPVIGSDLKNFLRDFGISYSALTLESAEFGGGIFATYLKNGGKRGQIIADFIIGAHALHQTSRLLTRDEGFQRKYFEKLRIWYP